MNRSGESGTGRKRWRLSAPGGKGESKTADEVMPSVDKTTRFAVSGMRSNDCREVVVQALASVKGVKDVSVSLIRAEALVTFERPCEVRQLLRAIFAAGYSATVASKPDDR